MPQTLPQETISHQDFSKSLHKSIEIKNHKFSTEEIVERVFAYGIMPQLVKEIILDQSTAEIVITAEEQKLVFEEVLQQLGIDTNQKLVTWLERQCMTKAQLEIRAQRSLKLKKFKQQMWGSKVNSTFWEQKTKLDRVIYSLIRLKDFCTAQELYFRIKDGENSFDEIAKEYSQGIESETGGLTGPVELGSIHPSLVKILTSIDPGEIQAPSVIGEWIVLVRLEKFLPVKLDLATEQRLIDESFNKWLEETVAQEMLKIKAVI